MDNKIFNSLDGFSTNKMRKPSVLIDKIEYDAFIVHFVFKNSIKTLIIASALIEF